MKGKGFIVLFFVMAGLSLIFCPLFSPAPFCAQKISVTDIGPANSLGTNQAGASCILSGGRATGNAAGGGIEFKTSDVWSSGNRLQSLSTKAIITGTGRLGINITSPTAYLDANTSEIRLRIAKTPATTAAAGYLGNICWDPNYIYICTAVDPNTGVTSWKRTGMLHVW